ncbi:MAG: RibD family protein [Pseudomonadota bacterium]
MTMLMPAGATLGSRDLVRYDADLALSRLELPRPPRPAGPLPSVVVGQLGQSLDGRIATPTGASKYINGQEALRHLHAIRARVDAVIVGVGTAIADDPQLTCRHVIGRDPARVVIDPRGRMPSDLGMLRDDRAPVIVITLPGATVPEGADHLVVPGDAQGRMAPSAVVAALAGRGLRRLLVEGGAETLARFLDVGLLDELHLMLAPIVLGSGKTGLNLAPIAELDEALRPSVRIMRFADGDMLCVCAFDCAVGRRRASAGGTAAETMMTRTAAADTAAG